MRNQKKMINFAERYTEYWINESEEPKGYFFSEREIEEYVRQFPRGTMILTTLVELDCKGHTSKQIMGYDELDCGVKHEFLEHPKWHFIKSLWLDFVDFLKQTKN